LTEWKSKERSSWKVERTILKGLWCFLLFGMVLKFFFV
jgi:hypothetical protein